MLINYKYIYLVLVLHIPSFLCAAEENDMSAFDEPLPPFVYYPGVKYTIPTINITRKSDGTEASFITGQLAFDIMFELGGIKLDNKGTSLVFLWNTSSFNANEQETRVNESVTVSNNVSTSISGYYSYIAATIIKKSPHKDWSNVLDTFGVGLGIGTGRFSGTAKFAINKEYTDSTPILKVMILKAIFKKFLLDLVRHFLFNLKES